MVEGKRWVIHDSDGNSIYLTQERWQHIIGAENHPEMEDFEDLLKLTLRRGSRRQEPLNPRKYRYVHPFNNLPDGSNHIVAIILFGFDINEKGQMTANNYVATAYFKHIKIKG